MTTAAANDPTKALWETLREFIVQAFTLFGAPHEIAQFGVRLREKHKLFLHYLRQCETLLRKLLFIEALALAPPLAHSLAKGRQRTKPAGGDRPRRFHTQDPENSEQWRVTFRVCASPAFDGRPRCARPAQASATDHPNSKTQTSPEPVEACPERRLRRRRGKATNSVGRFTSTWPAAERFEALLRAFNNPALYVKRLARLIQRNTRAVRSYFLHVPERTYGQSVLEEPIRDATLLIRARKRDPDSS